MFIFEQITLIFMIIATAFWLLNELEVAKKKYTKSNNVTKQAKLNNDLLLYLSVLSFVSVFALPHVTNIGQFNSPALSIAGSVIAILSIFMRRVSINTLGKNFDALVQHKEGQRVIKDGLYKNFRHPSYTASVLTFFGLGMASMNIFNMILLPVLFTVVYHYRIDMEEEVLVAGFGKEYEDYREDTWKLFPTFKKKKNKKQSSL